MATRTPKYWTRTDEYATPHASLDQARRYAMELSGSVTIHQRTRNGWRIVPNTCPHGAHGYCHDCDCPHRTSPDAYCYVCDDSTPQAITA